MVVPDCAVVRPALTNILSDHFVHLIGPQICPPQSSKLTVVHFVYVLDATNFSHINISLAIRSFLILILRLNPAESTVMESPAGEGSIGFPQLRRHPLLPKSVLILHSCHGRYIDHTQLHVLHRVWNHVVWSLMAVWNLARTKGSQRDETCNSCLLALSSL